MGTYSIDLQTLGIGLLLANLALCHPAPKMLEAQSADRH